MTPPRDARVLQIGVLASLLAVQLAWLDFGASAGQAAVTVAAALAVQLGAGLVQRRAWDWRSPLITGLSLTLLLRSHDPAVWVSAALLGIGSKMLLRSGGKHLFNPACFGIVAMLLTGKAWVSPGQWGTLAWTALLLGGGAALILGRAGRVDTAVAFFAAYASLLAARCMVLGDPWTIPWHQVQSGALLIFGLFMVTDPRTTPDSRVGRVLLAAAVASAAFVLQFHWQVREGLFYALVLAAPLVPMLDRLCRYRPLPPILRPYP